MCLNKRKLDVFVVRGHVLSNISQTHLIQIIHKLRITSAPYLRTLSRCIILVPYCLSGRGSFNVFRFMSSQDMDRFLLTLREVHSQPCSMALGTLATRSCTPFESFRHKNKIYSLFLGSLISLAVINEGYFLNLRSCHLPSSVPLAVFAVRTRV